MGPTSAKVGYPVSFYDKYPVTHLILQYTYQK